MTSFDLGRAERAWAEYPLVVPTAFARHRWLAYAVSAGVVAWAALVGLITAYASHLVGVITAGAFLAVYGGLRVWGRRLDDAWDRRVSRRLTVHPPFACADGGFVALPTFWAALERLQWVIVPTTAAGAMIAATLSHKGSSLVDIVFAVALTLVTIEALVRLPSEMRRRRTVVLTTAGIMLADPELRIVAWTDIAVGGVTLSPRRRLRVRVTGSAEGGADGSRDIGLDRRTAPVNIRALAAAIGHYASYEERRAGIGDPAELERLTGAVASWVARDRPPAR